MSDDEVYQQCAADAVEHMLGGKVASLFMFLGIFSFSKVFFVCKGQFLEKTCFRDPSFGGGK